MPKIKDLPKVERPREKLIAKGAENLKDSDLLAILLRTGKTGKNVIEIASQILAKHSKKRILQMTYQDMLKISGIDSAKATTLLAAFELSKRALEVNDTNLTTISTAKDVVAQLTELRNSKKEHFVALYLNARDQLVHKETISIGTLNANLVHPREIFEPALKYLAANITVAHNHPSGDPKPSEDDLEITKRLVKAGKMMGIELLDHVIVSKNSHFSFKEKQLI
ncbi:MAG TPA: JAB domain-containing protein [Candidatus Jorgensenbacteria bacterium]|nr:JAB domain-containing protein [Candidatus Jorgensenbacteria bacterium]